MNVLVVFYSRTGVGRRVAHDLSRVLHCENEEIVDDTIRRGAVGYARCTLDSIFGRHANLRPFAHDLASYDLVIVGSPIWDFSVSSPARTFLETRRSELPSLAFYLTCGGSGSGRALQRMAAAAGKQPIAELVLKVSEVERGDHHAKMRRFVEAIGGAPYVSHASVATRAP